MDIYIYILKWVLEFHFRSSYLCGKQSHLPSFPKLGSPDS